MTETLTKLLPALIKAKQEFGPVLKDALNPAFKSKYASLDSVLDAVMPALLRNDLLLTQPTRVTDDGKAILQTFIWHTSGEHLLAEWPLNPTNNTPQAEGSALTYGKRYAVLSLLGIAPEDDDGNAASRSSQRDDGDQWVAYDSMQPLKDAIDHADTIPALEGLFDKCANAKLTHADAMELKGYYDARMAELQGVLV